MNAMNKYSETSLININSRGPPKYFHIKRSFTLTVVVCIVIVIISSRDTSGFLRMIFTATLSVLKWLHCYQNSITFIINDVNKGKGIEVIDVYSWFA